MSILSRLPFIYDVATSDKNWVKALDQFCDASGAKGASLFSSSNTNYPFSVQALNSFYDSAQDTLAEYFNTHEEIDTQGAVFTFRQQPFLRILDEDIWPGFTEFEDRPDLSFLANNFKIFRRAAYNLSNSKGWNAAIALHYDINVKNFEKKLDQDANFLALHLGKALEINRFYSKLRQKYSAVLTALDHVDVGVCVASPDGEVIVKNHYAQRLFDANDGLSINSYNRIKSLNPDVNAELDAHIKQCAGTAQGNQNAAENIILLNRKSENDPYLIEITPLRDGDDELNDNITGAFILIIDPNDSPSVESNTMKKLYSFTDTETEMIELLFQGKSEQEISDIRGVKLNTVKNQRKAIYSKTGVKSRAQLIKKAISISPPIK